VQAEVLDGIGSTPVVRLERLTDVGSAEIWVKLEDFLIVGLGDSNASGEGNPDVPGLARPLWEDFRCDRSAQSYQARAASAIEKASDHSSVTFVHLACSGASFRVDRAFMFWNPEIASPVMAASAPPVMMQSAAPERIRSNDSPMACAEEAHAETVAKLGPLRP